MRRVGAWGIIAVLMMGLGVVVMAEEPDGDSKSNPNKNGWWSGWFGDKPKPKVNKKGTPADEKPAPPSATDVAALEQKRQMNAYLRRVQVCDRLRQVAVQVSNSDLQRQADEMEARAWEIYRQQTDLLPMPTQPPGGDTKTMERKIPAKRVIGSGELNEEKYNDASSDLRLPNAEPARAPQRLGGDFDQRERDAMRDTIMGGERP